MNDDFPTTSEDPTDLDAARRNVARAEERLSSRWRAAKLASERTVGRALSAARPLAIGAVVVGGTAWLVTALVRGRRGKSRRSSPSERSLAGEMARAAALALASTAARRLGERLAAHYLDPRAASSSAGSALKAGV